MRGRRVLVTGATGFIGGHLTARLVAAGAETHVLTRQPIDQEGALARLGPHLTAWTGDITDAESVRRAVNDSRADVVFHLAADTGSRRRDLGWAGVERAIRVNLDGTLNVLRAALDAPHGVVCFVRAGGLEEYGNGPMPYRESQREAPISAYSASQVAATHFCQMLQQDVATSIVTLRPALVYGPGQSEDFFIPSLIRSCLRNEDYEMTSGEQRRDLLYIDDAVAAFLLAAARPNARGLVINVGHGIEHAMKDVALHIVRLSRSKSRVIVGAKPLRQSDLMNLVTDNRLAAAALGWKPSVDLEDGLSRTIAAYRVSLQSAIGTV